MREHTVESLQSRYDDLEQETAFEGWRQLSHDVLSTLVEQQGLVIALQRNALTTQRGPSLEDRAKLRARAEAAFLLVQRLHLLRRKLHILLAEKRNEAAQDVRYFAVA